jgi:hypothetical protein
MTIEAATYINTLNASYPEGSSPANELDNHARLIKSALLATLPNITGPVTATHTELNQLAGATALTTATAGQMTLMKAVTISGSPSAVDFVNGSGGVVLSTAYDEYLLVFSDIRHASSTNAKLRMYFSADAGSTWTAGNTIGIQVAYADGTPTAAGLGLSYLPLMAEQANASATAAPGVGGQVRMNRPPGSTATLDCFVDYRGHNSGGGRGGFVRGAQQSNIADGLRIMWDSGNFANTGTIKLYGRKV